MCSFKGKWSRVFSIEEFSEKEEVINNNADTKLSVQ